ncbi:hypothetical protein ACXYX3_06700 [Mycobacterium sp. C3-094]
MESRVLRVKLFAAAVVGLVVGALIGAVVAMTIAAEATATAFVRLHNPADLSAIAGGASQVTPDNQSNTGTFVAGEIAYLSGEGFGQAVAAKLAKNKPVTLEVAQAAESSVVTISATAPTAQEAVRAVQTAIDVYGQQLQARMDAQLRTIVPTLDQWQRNAGGDIERLQDVQRLRDSVELQALQASKLDVVQPPTTDPAGSHRWVTGAVLGAVVGAGLMVATLLVLRRRSGRAALVKTVTDTVDGIMLPAVDFTALPPEQLWGDKEERLARTLYTQCASADAERTILVVGVSASSGAGRVVDLLRSAAGAAGGSRVVSGGAVGDATLTPEAVAAATDIVLVARLEHDTMAQALAARSVTASGSVPVAAVFTYRRSLKP